MSFEGYCPKTYANESLIATVLFFPLGLLAMMYSKRVKKYYADKDNYNLSVKYSHYAGNLSFIAIFIGIVWWIAFYFIFLS